MSTVFVIKNQHGHYLGKQKQWLDGRDRRQLFRTIHQDEAVNLVFELSSKDISLRAQPLICELDHSDQPTVQPGPPLPLEQATSTKTPPEQDSAPQEPRLESEP